MTLVPTASSGLSTYSGGPNVFLSAAQWVQAVLLGPLATSFAVIALASIGLLMLSGRVNIRRGATVIVGCFILFGAAGLAQGLRAVATSLPGDAASSRPVPTRTLPPVDPSLASSDGQVGPADPYAGASIRRLGPNTGPLRD